MNRKHSWRVTPSSLIAEGDATAVDYTPSSTEIQAAMRARQGHKALMRSGNIDRVEPEFRKALSSFSFWYNGFCSRQK